MAAGVNPSGASTSSGGPPQDCVCSASPRRFAVNAQWTEKTRCGSAAGEMVKETMAPRRICSSCLTVLKGRSSGQLLGCWLEEDGTFRPIVQNCIGIHSSVSVSQHHFTDFKQNLSPL